MSLADKQFRRLDQGKGPAVVEALGRSRAEALIKWDEAEGAELGGSRIVSGETGKPIEGTQGRGLRQAVARIIALAVFDPASGEYLEAQEALVKSVQKGLKKAGVAFEDVEFSKLIASVPSGGLLKAWDWLITSK